MISETVSRHIYTIDNFLSEVECDRFIQLSEDVGYEVATVETDRGPKIVDRIRNNFRALHNDSELAVELWERIKGFVPQKLGNSRASGLNELFRFYKYDSGHRFKKHIDESFIRNVVVTGD